MADRHTGARDHQAGVLDEPVDLRHGRAGDQTHAELAGLRHCRRAGGVVHGDHPLALGHEGRSHRHPGDAEADDEHGGHPTSPRERKSA